MANRQQKTSVKKTTTPKKSVAKKPVTKKAAAKSTRSTKLSTVSTEKQYAMVEVAAYYIAEHNGFKGNTTDFWIAAEEEISQKVA